MNAAFLTNMMLSRGRIYADWAATTPMHPKVQKAMAKAGRFWANPSGIHKEGVEARKMLSETRTKVARIIGTKPEEVYFTSGGTEANATIIQGVIRIPLEQGVSPDKVHVVSTSIEHSSVLEVLRLFEKHGVKVTYVAPMSDGIVRAEDILGAITPETVLVTCMYANNEIGTIQPISKIGAGIRKIRAEKLSAMFPVFHTDASQAPLWLSCDLEGLRADAMTLDAHKMQGPKGVGALIVRRHVTFEPLMLGGGQERGKRPTTESLPLVVGFGEALSIASKERQKKSDQAKKIQDFFLKQIEKEIPKAVINGSTEKRLPNNINLSLPDISDPEMVVLSLDNKGIACSTKSSCLKGEENSYVVASLENTALKGSSWRAKNTLRFTLAPNATKNDVHNIVKAIRDII